MEKMKPLEDIYKAAFFSRREKLSWRAPLVCNAIAKVLRPHSVIDVGCAIGDYVEYFNGIGISAYGLEGSKRCIPFFKPDKERIYIRDLRKKIRISRTFNLAMCLEVLEHVEPEYADQLVENLCKLSGRVLVSAAPPGAGGHYHVNCQPPEYWIEKFRANGYAEAKAVVSAIRTAWEPYRTKKEMSAYYKNLMFFQEL